MTQSTMFDVPAAEPSKRKADAIFEVLEEIFYPDGIPIHPKQTRKDLNAVAAGFRSQNAEPYEIREAFEAARAARNRGDAAYDAAPGFALLKHFGRFRDQLRQELRRRFFLFRKRIIALDPNLGFTDALTYLGWLCWAAKDEPPQFVGGLLAAARKDYTKTVLEHLTHWDAGEIDKRVKDRVCRIMEIVETENQEIATRD